MTKKIRVELTAAEIRKRFRLPDNAELAVEIPGGRDWANEDLSVDDHPVVATWTEEIVTEGGK